MSAPTRFWLLCLVAVSGVALGCSSSASNNGFVTESCTDWAAPLLAEGPDIGFSDLSEIAQLEHLLGDAGTIPTPELPGIEIDELRCILITSANVRALLDVDIHSVPDTYVVDGSAIRLRPSNPNFVPAEFDNKADAFEALASQGRLLRAYVDAGALPRGPAIGIGIVVEGTGIASELYVTVSIAGQPTADAALIDFLLERSEVRDMVDRASGTYEVGDGLVVGRFPLVDGANGIVSIFGTRDWISSAPDDGWIKIGSEWSLS